MLLVKGAREGYARDSHFLLRAILDYPQEKHVSLKAHAS